MKKRADGRRADEMRPIMLEPGFQPYAEGSVLVSFGNTRVLCAASVEERVPPFLKGTGQGWITGEYAMLPRATHTRTPRDSSRGVSGRAHEIQRLIGRSLRAVANLRALGERTVWVDCDVLQADGGTRTAAISGGFVALILALDALRRKGLFEKIPVHDHVAAVSVGIFEDAPLLDLCYEEDQRAAVDMNVVLTGQGRLVEVQGTAETATFDRAQLDAMLDLAARGTERIVAAQRQVLAPIFGTA